MMEETTIPVDDVRLGRRVCECSNLEGLHHDFGLCCGQPCRPVQEHNDLRGNRIRDRHENGRGCADL